MNQLSLDLKEVEALEWKIKESGDESDLYSVRIHLKSGKMYTRQLFEEQFRELKEQYKEIIGSE